MLTRKLDIFVCLTVILLLGAGFMTLSAAGGDTRAASVMIDSVVLDGTQAASPGEEFADDNINITVNVKNGDTTLLDDTTVECTIYFYGTTTVGHQFSTDTSLNAMLPGEEATIKFGFWDPSAEGKYNISLVFSGTTFLLEDVMDSKVVTLEVKNVVDVGAYIAPHIFNSAQDKNTKAYLQNTELTPSILIQNDGNIEPPVQTVFYTVYDNTATQNISGLVDVATHFLEVGWEELTPIASGLPTGDYNIHIWFENYTALDFNLTFATDAGSESGEIANLNLYEGQTIPVDAIDLFVIVNNCGNSDWSTLDPMLTLYVHNDSTGECAYYEERGNIKSLSGDIDKAGAEDYFIFSFSQLPQGSYHFNVSLKDTAGNTTIYNFLNRSISVADIDAAMATTFDQPVEGGVYLVTYGVQVSIMVNAPNYPQGDVLVDGEITDDDDNLVKSLSQVTLQFNSFGESDQEALWHYNEFTPGNYKAKAWINGTTTKTEVTFTVSKMPNGTVSGTVTGAPAGLDVSISNATTTIRTVQTDASGNFDFGLAGVEEDLYSVAVDGGYYYSDDVNTSVIVLAGQNTAVGGLAITAFNTGMVNVTCDIEGALITIAGELSMAVNKVGNINKAYFDKVVVGTVNVSASKLHYDTAWNDSVVVVAGNATDVYLELPSTPLPVSTSPIDNTESVALDEPVKVVFREKMNLTNLENNIFLMQGTTDVTGTLTTTDNVTFNIGHELFDYSTSYMIKVGKYSENVTGAYPLWMDFSATFTTLKRPDAIVVGKVTGPQGTPIINVTVSFKTFNVQTCADGTYSLDIEMDAAVVPNQTIWANGKSVGYSKEEATGIPLTSGQTTHGVDFVLTMLPPELSITPADGAEGIALDADIDIRFNYPLNTTKMVVATNDTTSLDQAFFGDFFVLEADTRAPVTGHFSLSIDNMTITFDPDQNLSEDKDYTIHLRPLVDYEDEFMGRPLYWDHTIKFTTLVLPKPITVESFSPTGEEVPLDQEIVLVFGRELNKSMAEAAVTISPAIGGKVYNWTGNTTLRIAHDDFEPGTDYNVSLARVGGIAPGYYLDEMYWSFTTMAEAPNFTIEIGPLMNEDNEAVKGAHVEATLPNGTKVSAETNEEGIAVFDNLSWEEFPAGTKFKATHDDYKDPIEWTDGEEIPEFKMGALPFFVFIVIGVILLVVLIVIIVVILYGGRKDDEAVEEEVEEGMMECPECGALVKEDAKSCSECNEDFTGEQHRCPECGSKIDQEATTCDECGAEFDDIEE